MTPRYVPIYCAKWVAHHWPFTTQPRERPAAGLMYAAKVAGVWRCTGCGAKVLVAW